MHCCLIKLRSSSHMTSGIELNERCADCHICCRGRGCRAVLMIEEAGGRVSHYDGTAFDIYSAPILASNGLVHEQMMRVLSI